MSTLRRHRLDEPYLPAHYLTGHYVRTESPGATSITRTPGNHDATPPVQCWARRPAKRADDFRASHFLLQGQDSIVQIHFFEYEVSRWTSSSQ